jgi:hypothetical protein
MFAEPSDWPEFIVTSIIAKCFEANWSFYSVALQVNKTWNSIAENLAQRHPCPGSVLNPSQEIPQTDKQLIDGATTSVWQPFDYPLFSMKEPHFEFLWNFLHCKFQRVTQTANLSSIPWKQPPWWVYQPGFIEAIVFDTEPQEIEFWSLSRDYGISVLQPDEFGIVWLNMLPSGKYFCYSHIFFTTKQPATVRFISHLASQSEVFGSGPFEQLMSEIGLSQGFLIRLGTETFSCFQGILSLGCNRQDLKSWQGLFRQHVRTF